MNSTLAFSGPLFATLPVSYSWRRNNPASLFWWELSRIFVGALWGSILYGVMFRNWLEYVDLQRVHRFALSFLNSVNPSPTLTSNASQPNIFHHVRRSHHDRFLQWIEWPTNSQLAWWWQSHELLPRKGQTTGELPIIVRRGSDSRTMILQPCEPI